MKETQFWGLPAERRQRIVELCRDLTVEQVDTAAGLALDSFSRELFIAERKEVGQAVIYEIVCGRDGTEEWQKGWRKGATWGRYVIVPRPEGGVDQRLKMNLGDDKPMAYNAMLTLIYSKIEQRYGDRQTDGDSLSTEVLESGMETANGADGEEELERQHGKTEPWKKIPNYRWDRTAVELLHKGYTSKEIGREVGRAEKTVNNRLSLLRQQFPKLVPTRQELEKRKRE